MKKGVYGVFMVNLAERIGSNQAVRRGGKLKDWLFYENSGNSAGGSGSGEKVSSGLSSQAKPAGSLGGDMPGQRAAIGSFQRGAELSMFSRERMFAAPPKPLKSK